MSKPDVACDQYSPRPCSMTWNSCDSAQDFQYSTPKAPRLPLLLAPFELRDEVVVLERLLRRQATVDLARDAQHRLSVLVAHAEHRLAGRIEPDRLQRRGRGAFDHAHDLIAAVTQVHVELREFRVE